MNAMPATLRRAMETTTDFYRGQRVVVTGALGFLGSCLLDELSKIDCVNVHVARRPSTAVAPAIAVVGDVRRRETWVRALAGADFVFHLAAETGAITNDSDRAADFEANVLPMLHCLDVCSGVARPPGVIFAGSVTQAGTCAPAQAATIYDEHKLVAERLLDESRDAGLLAATTLRLPNLYGPGPSNKTSGRGVLNATIRKALAGETLTVYGTGEFVRDYLYVRDAARAFLAAGAHLPRLTAGHYVIGTGIGHTIAQAFELVAARAAAHTGRAVRVVKIDPPRPLTSLDRRSFVADASAFRAVTGWRPEWGLVEGIDRTFEEMRCA